MIPPRCRFCDQELDTVFCDLGSTPLANAFLTQQQLAQPEPRYRLCAYVCGGCLLVQLEAMESPERIFGDYAYFSSYSETWLEHARRYAAMAVTRFKLSASSRVVEVASNDGYLLQYFRQAGIPVLGIEPAANVAAAAVSRGIPTITRFFGATPARELSARHGGADLLVANNVLAHVPDLNDFVAGLALMLGPRGVVTIEVPHLLRLIEQCQFDTIYHEHFSYFSFLTLERILARHGLEVLNVERLETHGGSLRVYAARAEARHAVTPAPALLRQAENAAGLDQLATYQGFDARVQAAARELKDLLLRLKQGGATIAAYGAAAKGNTLLNYCGVGGDIIAFVADGNPYKQGRFLPGTHLPVRPPEAVRAFRPDYLLILPWNIAAEITRQMAYIREWGGKFIVPVPAAVVLP